MELRHNSKYTVNIKIYAQLTGIECSEDKHSIHIHINHLGAVIKKKENVIPYRETKTKREQQCFLRNIAYLIKHSLGVNAEIDFQIGREIPIGLTTQLKRVFRDCSVKIISSSEGDDSTQNDVYFSIKLPMASNETPEVWGDYYVALSLKKEMERKGYCAELCFRDHWYDPPQNGTLTIAFVLRGPNCYKPQKDEYAILWHFSHPDLVAPSEYNDFDTILLGSESYFQMYQSSIKGVSHYFPQCTDDELFSSIPMDLTYQHDVLFVGNTRGVYRKIVKDMMTTGIDFSVYGLGWRQFLESRYIAGDYIPNIELHKAYSSCKILLNDHYDDMREHGFVSNRIYDACACGAFVISDDVRGLKEQFGDLIPTYRTLEELKEIVGYYLDHEEERKAKAEVAQKIVLEQHTYRHRVSQLSGWLKEEFII